MKKLFLFTTMILLFFMFSLSAGEKKSSKSAKPAKNVVTGIRFEVIPVENTIAFIDGKKVGEVSKIDIVPVKPGKHTIKLVHKKDEVEVDVVVVKKQILDFKYAFEDSGKGISGFSEEEKEGEDANKNEKAGEGGFKQEKEEKLEEEKSAE